MRRRALGDTGLNIPEVGFGAWQLGGGGIWSAIAPGEEERLVALSLEAGCNFFDTAPTYGKGHSEEVLGRALKGRRDEAILCTKFGVNQKGEKEFTPEVLRWCLEGSLRRLQTDHVEVLLLHGPPLSMMDQNQPVYLELEKLRREGKVLSYGASVDSAEYMRAALGKTHGQVLEILFNAFFQEPASAFPECRAKGVGLIAKVPLDSGWLSGKYGARSRFTGVRSRWTPADIECRAALVEDLRAVLPQGADMAAAAIQFILAHPEVSTVIPGVVDAKQLSANLAASAGVLDAPVLAAVRRLWEERIREAPLEW